jgi:hypothetical protein
MFGSSAHRTLAGVSIAYRIRVGGALDPSWSDRLGGLHIAHLPGAQGVAETLLEGRLEDQAALAGVLNTLFELMVPILSAERLETAAIDMYPRL